jgi:hypothetical protein
MEVSANDAIKPSSITHMTNKGRNYCQIFISFGVQWMSLPSASFTGSGGKSPSSAVDTCEDGALAIFFDDDEDGVLTLRGRASNRGPALPNNSPKLGAFADGSGSESNHPHITPTVNHHNNDKANMDAHLCMHVVDQHKQSRE